MRSESARQTILACLVWGGMILAAGSAPAQEAESHPVDSALKMLDMKTEPGPMPGFVQATRPKGDVDYVPIGMKHQDRAIKVKTPSEIAAATAELDAARDAQLTGKRPKPGHPAPKAVSKPLKIMPKVATDR